jgi:hypothetical protein
LTVFKTRHSCLAPAPFIKQLIRTMLTELNSVDPEFALQTCCDVCLTFPHTNHMTFTTETKNTGALFYLTTRITRRSDPTASRQAAQRLPLLRLACVGVTNFSSVYQCILSCFLVLSYRENAGVVLLQL